MTAFLARNVRLAPWEVAPFGIMTALLIESPGQLTLLSAAVLRPIYEDIQCKLFVLFLSSGMHTLLTLVSESVL